MIDLDILRQKGIDEDKLKALFSAKKKKPEIEALVNRISSRIRDGVTRNITDSKVHYAVDLAWNAPLRQTTYTLMQTLVNRSYDDAGVQKAVEDWGLSHLITEAENAKGEPVKKLNLQTFFHVFVPLVKAYVTARWAAIVNSYNQVPFFKYEPKKNTQANRAQCEVITDRCQDISTQYDYLSVFRQSVLQMLLYSNCLQFPAESWHRDEQIISKPKSSDQPSVRVVREGIRYHTPHPSRTFYDLGHRLSTFNSDSGCSFAGYWTVKRYGDIANSGYWNEGKITKGQTDWISSSSSTYFTNVYPCAVNWPVRSANRTSNVITSTDRESNIEYYGTDDADKSVLEVNYFEKLNPKKCGLGDYDHEVWFRFILSNDDTVQFCEPLPYVPPIAYVYDSNENQSLNASLALEIVPFQDHVGQLLSQYVLSVKQNLANMTFYDQDQIDEKDMNIVRNWGEKMFRTFNFIKFSSRKARMAQADPTRAFISHRFPQLPTEGIATAIGQVINILERAMMLSSQEIGQPSTHEQTAEEVRHIATATSNRLSFTKLAVEQAINAWKRQLYQGLMAYGEEEFYSDLTIPVSKEKLEGLGFTVEEDWSDETKSMHVKVNKTAISIDAFSSARDGDNRINNAAMAKSMSDLLIGTLNNPIMAQAIGAKQALEWMNYIATLAGLPRDIKFQDATPPGATPEAQAEEARNQLMQMAQEIRASITEEVGGGLKELSEAIAQGRQADEQIVGAVEGIAGKVKEHDAALAQLVGLIQQAAATPPPTGPTAYDSMQPAGPPVGPTGPVPFMA